MSLLSEPPTVHRPHPLATALGLTVIVCLHLLSRSG
jgi:hypothetical protein